METRDKGLRTFTTAAIAASLFLAGAGIARAQEMRPQATGSATATPVVPAPYPPPPVVPAGYPPPASGVAPYGTGNGVPDPHRGQPFLFGSAIYRSPGLAVALSLQPLPVDFGNLYAENLGWGIAYTVVEVALATPMMWMTGQHMGHDPGDNRRWTGMETGMMVGFVSGYVVVKIVAGLHAGYAASSFNRTYEARGMAVVVPTAGGALFAWSQAL